jgi:REP element-mobilizing transposase RayT
MTAPRQILPGKTYLVTRRCSERRFFLRPSKETNELVRYLLAVLSQRYGIALHAFCVMSDHIHLVLTDPLARLPDFQRDLGAFIARAMNLALGRGEALWARRPYSAVRLETHEAVLEKIGYVLANPVAAGLVRHGREWPGLWSDFRAMGRPGATLARPEGFFREKGPLPAVGLLELHPPPGRADVPALTAELAARLRREEDQAAARLSAEGRSFAGAARVLAQNPADSATGHERRRSLSPRIATKDAPTRISALAGLAEFRTRYREAFAAWTKGIREVEFPAGTWLMRVRHLVRCAAFA